MFGFAKPEQQVVGDDTDNGVGIIQRPEVSTFKLQTDIIDQTTN